MTTVHASPAPVQPGPSAAWPAWTDAVAYWPADVEPTGPTPADAAWAAQEFGTLADRRVDSPSAPATPAPKPATIKPRPYPRASEHVVAEYPEHTPHPARRTFVVSSGDYEHERVCRVGVGVRAVVAAELEDHWAGLRYDMKHFGKPCGSTTEDRGVWELVDGVYKLRAVILHRADAPGRPVVHVFEE